MSSSFPEEAMTINHTSGGREFNEFAHIEGLGPAMRRWLRESFHIYTIADLANLSVELVLSRLRDEEKNFCRRDIERWIQQAQSFVAHQTPWHTFATFVVSLQSRQIGGQTEQRTTAYFLEADRRKIWSGIECHGAYELMLDQLKQAFHLEPEVKVPMSSESMSESKLSDSASTPSEINLSERGPISKLKEIKYESKAESSEIDQTETEVETLERSKSISESTNIDCAQSEPEPKSIAKMESEVDESLDAATDVSLKQANKSKPGTTIAEPLTLEITQLKFWQPYETPMVVDRSKRSLPRTLHQGRPLEMGVTLQLAGTGAVDLTRKLLSYHVQCFIQNRESRKQVQLEKLPADTLVEGEITYTKRLPEIALLEPGIYRLQVIARLDGGYVSPDCFELPLVQVV